MGFPEHKAPTVPPQAPAARPRAGWGFRLAMFALLLQAVAAALPMPAAALAGELPLWAQSSLCQGDGGAAPAERPDAPARLACPICFLQSAAGSAVPPQPPAMMSILPWRMTVLPAPALLTLPRQHAAFVALSRAPPAA